jgi:general secretion pathway protein G
MLTSNLVIPFCPAMCSRSRQRRSARRRAGFTLMEVLLVLAILVILGSMVTYYFVGAQKKAYARAAQSQIGMFERMMTDYRLDVGTYPTTSQGLEALRTAPTELANANKWGGPYVSKAIPLDPWGNPYQYELVDADNFRVWSWGPDAQDGTGDEVSNLTQ